MSGEPTDGDSEDRPERRRPARPDPSAGGAGATWLREELLGIAATLYPGPGAAPDRGPVLVRAWSDAVRLRDPEPVGRSHVVLVAAGEDAHAHPSSPPGSSPGFDEVLHAFRAAGWTAHPSGPDVPGERWAKARRADFEVRVHRGAGPGILTFTGWTPVVYTGRQLGQPLCTASTPGAVPCDDCHGWGVCMECEGTCRSDNGTSWSRCWCVAGNSGPGRCVECGGTGHATAATTAWKRRHHGLPDPDSAPGAGAGAGGSPRLTPIEDGHTSAVAAFTDVVHRSCACGEFRCLWHNALTEEDGSPVARFTGSCNGCATRRSYAFALPRHPLARP